jgi:hypothetical protein
MAAETTVLSEQLTMRYLIGTHVLGVRGALRGRRANPLRFTYLSWPEKDGTNVDLLNYVRAENPPRRAGHIKRCSVPVRRRS